MRVKNWKDWGESVKWMLNNPGLQGQDYRFGNHRREVRIEKGGQR